MPKVVKVGIELLSMLILVVPLVAAQERVATPSAIALTEAVAQAEQLRQELVALGSDSAGALDREVARQVDTGPKGEFETTAEYQERKAQVQKLRDTLRAKVEREQSSRQAELRGRLDALLAGTYQGEVRTMLGLYDADAQVFPLKVLSPTSEDRLHVMRAEARQLKEGYAQALQIGLFGLYLDGAMVRTYLLKVQVSYGGRIYYSGGLQPAAESALRVMYGNYDKVAKRAAWVLEGVPQEILDGSAFEEGEELIAKPYFNAPYREGSKDKVLLLIELTREDFDCHACAPLLGGLVFVREGDLWRVESATKVVGVYGSWGKPPAARLVKIGLDRHGVMLESGYFGMGIAGENYNYLADIGHTIKEVLSVPVSGDNSQGISNRADYEVYSSKVNYTPSGSSEFFDIKVTTTGRRAARQGKAYVLRPYTEIKVFRFVGGKYIQVE